VVVHQYRPAALVGIFAICLCLAWAGSLFVNGMGAIVFPQYYSLVLGWPKDDSLLRPILGQGLMESTFAGILLGLVYVVTVAIVTRAECPWRVGAGHLARWALLFPVFALAGGVIGIVLLHLSPMQMLHVLNYQVGGLDWAKQLRFIWVGGSIIGAYAGGFLLTILACVTMKAKWRRFRLTAGMIKRGWASECLKCGYSMRGSVTGICPECGTESTAKNRRQNAA
jgi:hypothetical protein